MRRWTRARLGADGGVEQFLGGYPLEPRRPRQVRVGDLLDSEISDLELTQSDVEL